jgi:hypothetical protein
MSNFAKDFENVILLGVAGAYIATSSIAADDAAMAGNVLAGRFATANVTAAVLMFVLTLLKLDSEVGLGFQRSRLFNPVVLTLFSLMYMATAANGASMERLSPLGKETSPMRKKWMVGNALVAAVGMLLGMYQIHRVSKGGL